MMACRLLVGSIPLVAFLPCLAQPPSHLRLATGPLDGTYRILGEAIQLAVQDSFPDLQIKLLMTGASFDNMRMLETGEADLALAQNDVIGELIRNASNKDSPPWRTVLVLLQEPVQIVVGPEVRGDGIDVLSSRPIGLGRPGSGTIFTAAEILKALNLKYVEIHVQSSSQLAQAIQRGEAHAGFFISNAPHPQVAALLADPGFRLLPLNTQELDLLHSASPYYVAATIPEHTYPLQGRSVTTIAVLTVLVCRADLSPTVVERLTMALLKDAASPASSLRRSRSAITLTSILQLTERSAVRLHDGAERAFHTLPLRLRAQAYIQWFQWTLFMTLVCVTLILSYLRRLRMSAFRTLSKYVPAVIAHSIRPLLFQRMLWRTLRTVSLLSMVWLAGSAAMYLFEREVNANFANLKASSLSSLVYLFSGFEDRIPVTVEGWIVSVVMLISGLLVVAYITGQFASEIVHRTSGVIQMAKDISKGNLLVIGWNPRAERVVRELFGAGETGQGHYSVAVLSKQKVDSGQFAEFDSLGVTFVAGHTFDKKVLEQLGAHQARSIIVMADDNTNDPDAETALNVLAIRSLCKEKGIPNNHGPRIVAEVMNHRKMTLIRDAGAHDVVCHQDFGLGILAQSAFAAKVTEIYDELLSYSPDTNEIYVLTSPREDHAGDIPEDLWDSLFQGKTFVEALEVFNQYRDAENPAILIGVRRGKSLMLNPRNTIHLQRGDDLVVIAFTRPRLDRWRRMKPGNHLGNT
jgi:voltage-gated potassium channel